MRRPITRATPFEGDGPPGAASSVGPVAGLVLATSAAVAFAVPAHKCVVDGTVTYQQNPCPSPGLRKRPDVDALNAEAKRRRAAAAGPTSAQVASAPRAASPAPGGFACDGRKHCTQMTSCAEATYFLAHCPGVTMDGDHDGLPCETQWCHD